MIKRSSMFDLPGVYLWRNKITGKVYVGSSISIKRRKLEHVLRLGKGDDGNEYFQRAWKKYGAKNFEFEVLEICEADERLELEQRWIEKLKATDEKFGYNLIPTRKSQLYGAALSKHQKRGWAKYTKKQRRQMNLHLNNPEAKKKALDRSNEVKQLQPWRDAMEPTWNRLALKWQDPVWAAAVIAAQHAGRLRAKKRKQRELRAAMRISEEIVRPTAK
jgi:group I intron endonuclease